MLVVGRKSQERFVIRIPGHPDIWVRYVRTVPDGNVRIGVEAPKYMRVIREELLDPEAVIVPTAPTRNF
jgi:sRNA-binding carbon storage regulator CsrA